MTTISECAFRFGRELFRDFASNCKSGDKEFFDIRFDPPFPPGSKIRVIATGSQAGRRWGVAIVPIAVRVQAGGATVVARNSDCASGTAGVNWMAVAETPGQWQLPVWLRLGMMSPVFMREDCSGKGYDWNYWAARFSAPVPKPPTLLLTASAVSVRGPIVAPVGLEIDTSVTGTRFSGRNSDCKDGFCGFNYVAGYLAENEEQDPRTQGMFVDTGITRAYPFEPDCDGVDWATFSIQFNAPFLAPPVVLVSAWDGAQDADDPSPFTPAVVPVVDDVTQFGFTVRARNSDCRGGSAFFQWVALGCGIGCG
jgi:hypothetical protein